MNERAAQFWPLLVWASHHRQTITYRNLSQCTGVHLPGLGKCLEPIQSYCIVNKLPPLTSLVVDEDGAPGAGFTAASLAAVSKAQAQVFKRTWLGQPVPTDSDFEAAVLQNPSNGVPQAAATVT